MCQANLFLLFRIQEPREVENIKSLCNIFTIDNLFIDKWIFLGLRIGKHDREIFGWIAGHFSFGKFVNNNVA
jgi:hypothetical protein